MSEHPGLILAAIVLIFGIAFVLTIHFVPAAAVVVAAVGAVTGAAAMLWLFGEWRDPP